MDADLARAMAGLTTGIYVLTVATGDQHHGMSSSWVTQVSGAPLLFSAAVDKHHFSHAIIEQTGVFGLNVAGVRGSALEEYFYSARARRPENLRDLPYDLSPTLRVPWLKLAMVCLAARVTNAVSAGDHTIFIGEPVEVMIRDNDRPLTSLDLDYVYVGGKETIARDRRGW